MVSHLRAVLGAYELWPSFNDGAFVAGGDASSVDTPWPSGFGSLCRNLTDLKMGRLIVI
jgi:hypothetical protein